MKIVEAAKFRLPALAALRRHLWVRAFAAANAAPRMFVDALSMRVSAVAMTVVMVVSPTLTFAQSIPPGVIEGKALVAVTNVQGDSVALRTPRDLTVAQLNVFRSLTLAADTINVVAKQLPSMPPVPLHVTISGFNGGVATSANLNIDPPQVIIDQYKVVDSVLVVDSPNLNIVSGYVPGQLALSTPAGQILLNNRTPAPTNGVNLQLYQPDGQFSMLQIGSANYSNTQVVWYDATISSVITNYGGGNFGGTSFVRDALQDMQNNGAFDPLNSEKSGLATFYLLGPQGLGFRDSRPLPIEVLGDGPAVNVEGLFERKTPSSKRNRANARTTELSRSGVRVAGGSR